MSTELNEADFRTENLQLLKDVYEATSPRDVFDAILDRVLAVARANRAEIALWDARTQSLRFVALRGKRSLSTGDIGDAVPLGGMIAQVWKQKQLRSLVERHPDPAKGYFEVDTRTEGAATFRLHRRGIKFGILNVEWFNRKNITNDRVEDLRLLAEQAALAMNIADQTELLAGLAEGLSGKHDISRSLCRVLEGIRASYGFDQAFVYESNKRRRCLEARYILTGQKARIVRSKPWTYGFDERSLAVHVYSTGKPRYVSHPWRSQWVSQKGLKRFEIDGPLLGLPLIYAGKPLGAMVIWSRTGTVLFKKDIFSLKPIADLIAAYLGSNSNASDPLAPFDLLKTVLLQSQRAISPENAIDTILHTIQAFGFDRARYLRYDQNSKCFIRGPQLTIGKQPHRDYVSIDCRKSPYAAHLVKSYHKDPDARIFDPRSPESFGIDPDWRRLGKGRLTPWIAAPVSLQGRLIGQLAADNVISKREIPQTARHFMTLTASIAALVLSRLAEIDFSLLNEMPVAMFRKDKEGTFLSVNARFAGDVGKSLESVKGLTDGKLYPESLARKYREDDERVMNSKKVEGWVEENITPSRKTFVYVVKAPLLDAARRVIGVQGLYLDERYRAIFENATEGIYQSTPDGRFLDMNTAMAQLLGYSSRDELLAKKDFDIAEHVYDSKYDRYYFRDAIKKGSISNFEYFIRKKDGARIKVAEYAWEVRDSNKRLLYYEGIVRDISSQIRASARVSKAQAQSLLSSMALKIAHEVGNMIVALGSDVSILEKVSERGKGGVAARTKEILRGMRKQVSEACRVLDHYKAGERHVIYEPANVDNGIRFAQSIMSLSILQAGIQLSLLLNAKLATVELAEVELCQILVNLLKNSIEATRRSGKKRARIQIRTRILADRAKGKSSRVLIEYSDTCGGMNERKVGSLTQRSRLNDPREAGMGMLVVSKIVDGIGGTLSIASTLGKGSTFAITLPLTE
jgi:PAS domain S-box-containing protein